MKRFLEIPKTNYSDLIDIGKFDMIWRVNTALIFILFFLFFFRLFSGDSNLLTSILAFSVSIFNFIVLYKTRKYELISVISVISGIVICQVLFFIMKDDRIMADTLWVILVAYFAYFMLGILAGYITLFVNVTGFLLYLVMQDQMVNDVRLIDSDKLDLAMIINVYYVAFAVGYISHKMIQTNYEINSRLERQNAKNELLMKEIHHRVKNNLQIMSSLLKLQANESDDPVVQEQFDEAIGRIRSMALIHEQMYQSENLAETDIREFLLALAEHISVTTGTESNIELNVVSDLKELDIKILVPLSLIFNELLTNSLKHGFADRKDGKISISIQSSGKFVSFVYKDNGNWKEPDPKRNSFGLNLITTLSEQLDGSFERKINTGTTYEFKFDASHFNKA